MLFFSFTANASKNNEPASFLVWVDGGEHGVAEARARQLIEEQGWVVQCLEGVSETSRDDYFAPCPSLDAFDRAQSEGISFRIISL